MDMGYNFNQSTTPLTVVGDGLAFNNNDSKWIMFPIDMDGVPIHLGDEVYTVNLPPSYHFTVQELTLTEDGWEVDGYEPNLLSHWNAPKVSSLLMQFSADMNSSHRDASETGALIDEYVERIKEAIKYEQN